MYLVNPKHRRIAGRDCLLSIDQVPEAPDLAVIVTPPETIPSLIGALGEKGTRAAVVVTAGLGPELRQAMLDAARPACLRIIGPNCLGLWVPALGVNANFGTYRGQAPWWPRLATLQELTTRLVLEAEPQISPLERKLAELTGQLVDRAELLPIPKGIRWPWC